MMRNTLSKLSTRFKLISFSVVLLLALEGLSRLAFFYPSTVVYSFGFFVLVCFVLTHKRLEYGLLMIFAELITSSFGRMLSYDHVSLRMALFVVVMIMWWIRHMPRTTQAQKRLRNIYSKSPLYGILFVLAVLVSIGIIRGLLASHDSLVIFQDVNGYLFLLLFLPVFSIKPAADFFGKLVVVVSTAYAWLIIKSLLVFTYFTHITQPFFDTWQYQWLRDMRVAEITPYGDGLVRVFLQSHVFVALGFLILLCIPRAIRKQYISPNALFALLTGSTAVILMSLSRSMWLGVGVAGVVLVVWLLMKKKYGLVRYVVLGSAVTIGTGYLALSLLYGLPVGEHSDRAPLYTLFTTRVQAIDSEVAAASRWEQLPILFSAIKEKPILGHGFGTSLEIKNPHNTEISEERFAFEWGWFDTWIKVGLLGVFVYVWLLYAIMKQVYTLQLPRGYCQLKRGVIVAIIALAIIHIFTPYLNHPLGIGVLVLTLLAINNAKAYVL